MSRACVASSVWACAAIFQASTEHTEVWLAEGADHTVLYDKHPVEYRARVLGLLERVCEQVTAAAAQS